MYELIKKLCAEKGISPTKLCTEITGSKGNLPTWQKGNINPTSLTKIADYFDVSVDYLLGRTDELNTSQQQLTQNEQELLDIFKNFSERDQIKILGKMEDWANKVPVAPSTSQPEKVQKAPERPWRMAARSSDGSYTTRTLPQEEVEIIKSLEDGPEDF